MICLSPSDIIRFDASYKVGLPDECWEWLRGRFRGYGQFCVGRTTQRAHRVSFYLFNGFISDSLVVRHTCDNPPCVNPAHLALDSHAGNVADRTKKGRSSRGDRHYTRMRPESVRGERNGRALFTNAQAVEIRELAKTVTKAEIARRFRTSQTTIREIVNGQRYA